MIEVSLLNYMGDDLTVVNAARCSFGKRKECKNYDEIESSIGKIKIPILDEQDTKLIKYLAKHEHWTPMAHTQIQFHIKAPIFVARQLGKHQVGLVWNEISRRYCDSEPEFYTPKEWRLRNKNIKQGSSDETIEFDITEYNEMALKLYNTMLEKNIAPEMARMILPQNMMTEFYWTGSLVAFGRICKLRIAKDSQYETRIVAEKISEFCKQLFPITWTAMQNPTVITQ